MKSRVDQTHGRVREALLPRNKHSTPLSCLPLGWATSPLWVWPAHLWKVSHLRSCCDQAQTVWCLWDVQPYHRWTAPHLCGKSSQWGPNLPFHHLKGKWLFSQCREHKRAHEPHRDAGKESGLESGEQTGHACSFPFTCRHFSLVSFSCHPACSPQWFLVTDPGFFQSASRVETVLLVFHVLCKHRTLCCLWINHWAYMSCWIPQSQVSFLTYLFIQDLLRKGTTGNRSNWSEYYQWYLKVVDVH